ncbi:MAG TPA: TonB-dependent receptor [Steroidobacteraceae bacterium]
MRYLPWLAGMGLFSALPAWPQSVATPASPNAELAEVVVTAQRRTENLQDVPLSVQAFDQTALTQGGIKNLTDLVQRTPGVDITGNVPGNAVITIRGVAPIGGLPTTAMYIDDVPVTGIINSSYTGSPNPLINDTASVEVLKGPQGTLYGDSAMGGAVKFISNRPDANAFSGHANIEGDSTENASGSYEASGTLNAPLIAGKLALRSSFAYRRDGGYIDNVSPFTGDVTGTNVNVYKTVAARVALGITPDDSLSIVPALLYQRGQGDDRSYTTSSIPGPGPAPSYFNTAGLSAFEKMTYQPEPSTDRMSLATLTIEKHFGGADLTAVSGYFDRVNYEVTDATPYVLGALQGSPLYAPFANLLTTSYTTNTTQTFSQEVRLASHDSTAAFKWTAGVFFSDQRFNFYQPVVSAGLTSNLSALFGPGTTLATLVPGALPNDDVFLGNTTTETHQYAIFGEVSYQLTQTLKLTLGARAFALRQSEDRNADGFFNGGPTSDHPPSSSFHGVDPRIIVDYKVTSDNLLYASASEGFRPGIVNSSIPLTRCAADLAALGRTSVPSGAQPDSLWSYEIGSKNDFFSDHLRINAAAFQMNWKKIQLSVSLPTCGFGFEDNVGGARIRGTEISIDQQLAKGLTVGADATYIDAVITSAIPDVTFRAGDQLPDTPKQWVTAYTEWQGVYAGNVHGFVRADYQWRGDSVRDASSQSSLANYRYNGWSVANVNLGANWDKFELRLFVDNVFNKDPPIDFTNSWGQWRISTLRPRTVGLNLGINF